jgi:alkyl hydroperoxide reductase subunit D
MPSSLASSRLRSASCLESHEKMLREHGLSAEQVQAGICIAATVHATARTLAAEEALAPALAQAA